MCIVLPEKHKSLCIRNHLGISLQSMVTTRFSRAYTRKQINEVSLLCVTLFLKQPNIKR